MLLQCEVYSQHIIKYWNNSKVHGANMGPFWGRKDPGGPHVVSMNFAIWDKLDGSRFIDIIGVNHYRKMC